MSNKSQLNKGVVQLLPIVLIGVLLIAVGVFFLLSRPFIFQKTTVSFPSSVPTESTGAVEEELVPVSDSDEIDVIEAELDATNEGSFELDFQELDNEASSL